MTSDLSVKNVLTVVMKRDGEKSSPWEEIAAGGEERLLTRSVKCSKIEKKASNLSAYDRVKRNCLCLSEISCFQKATFRCLLEHKRIMQRDNHVCCIGYKILRVQHRTPVFVSFSFKHPDLMWPIKWMERKHWVGLSTVLTIVEWSLRSKCSCLYDDSKIVDVKHIWSLHFFKQNCMHVTNIFECQMEKTSAEW